MPTERVVLGTPRGIESVIRMLKWIIRNDDHISRDTHTKEESRDQLRHSSRWQVKFKKHLPGEGVTQRSKPHISRAFTSGFRKALFTNRMKSFILSSELYPLLLGSSLQQWYGLPLRIYIQLTGEIMWTYPSISNKFFIRYSRGIWTFP